VSVIELIVFWGAVALALVGAVGMVSARNPVHSALFLLANFLALAIIFLLLSAPLIAALQILVYAGAIMVLFLFVIFFFVSPGQRFALSYSLPLQNALAGLVVMVLIAVILTGLFFGGVFSAAEHPQSAAAVQATLTSPRELGKALFARYLLPFELTSLLLLAAMLGAVALARRGNDDGKPGGGE